MKYDNYSHEIIGASLPNAILYSNTDKGYTLLTLLNTSPYGIYRLLVKKILTLLLTHSKF